jgi:tetratricopeptide (TPR) repeat protein
MNKIILLACLSLVAKVSVAQKNQLLKELSDKACNCIDSIETGGLEKAEVTKKINDCIDEVTGAYQLGSKISEINLVDAETKEGKKKVNITLNTDNSSNEYKKYYYEIERYLMDSCQAIKFKVSTMDKGGKASYPQKPDALRLYYQGVDEMKAEKFSEAVLSFEKSLYIDSNSTFAWDNLGISYRRIQKYEKALFAYKKSLEIDPTGTIPLQNIPVVYQYMKEYDKAVEAYQVLAKVDPNNPEVFYGTGLVYTYYLNRYKDGLENMCRAYNLYVTQKSPYRADCEKVMQVIFNELKKQNNDAQFYDTLRQYNITTGGEAKK